MNTCQQDIQFLSPPKNIFYDSKSNNVLYVFHWNSLNSNKTIILMTYLRKCLMFIISLWFLCYHDYVSCFIYFFILKCSLKNINNTTSFLFWICHIIWHILLLLTSHRHCIIGVNFLYTMNLDMFYLFVCRL